MTGAYKMEVQRITLADAIANGYSEIQQLRDEMNEWKDNLENGNLGHTDKFSRVEECAEALDSEADNEPSEELPADLVLKEVSVSVQVNRRKNKGPSRAVRCSNACAYLQVVCDELEGIMEDLPTEPEEDDEGRITPEAEKAAEEAQEEKDTLEEIRDHLQSTIEAVEGIEFPGMYG